MKFALQAGLVPGKTFLEKFELLARWGYDGVEVSGSDLVGRAAELREAMEAYPVRVTSACGGYTGWLVDPNPRARSLAISEISAIVEAAPGAGAVGLVTPAAFGIGTRGVLPPFRGVFSPEEDRKLLLDSLAQIAPRAEASGGLLLLEPLNRYEDGVLNTLAEAVSVIEELGSPAVRLMPDFFHMNIEEADIPASLRAAGRHTAHVHLADSNRRLPGLGHTDFAPGFAALREVGFDGALAIECRVTGDPYEALPHALRFLRRAAGQPA
ncbi:MAG TPA: sugar phosphate isomerase/epimerase family protein [Herpetosiphonaceae bacterium]|nr:sugar phosphate isomerase/epimerase family protein [Herpetosiphonaceae bacterium]